MKSEAMQRLANDGKAYFVELRIGQLAFYKNQYYKKSGDNYEMIEDRSLLEFLINEYEKEGK